MQRVGGGGICIKIAQDLQCFAVLVSIDEMHGLFMHGRQGLQLLTLRLHANTHSLIDIDI